MGAQPSEQSVLVFGATGGTGQALIRRAIGANYAVSAFVRDSAKATATLGSMGDSIRLIIGDALDPQSVSAAFTTRPAAVLLSLGMYQSNSTDQTLTQATRNVVAAMQAAQVNRLINISSLGVGDSYQQGNFVARLVQRTTLKHTIADKEQQEKLLRESGLEVTCIRPSRLMSGSGPANWHAWEGAQPTDRKLKWAVNRDHVAELALRCLQDPDTIGRAFTVTGCI